MRVSDAGLKLIQTSESLRLSPYFDTASIPTIGWGHALNSTDGRPIRAAIVGHATAEALTAAAMTRLFGAQTITREQADAQLVKDCAVAEAAVDTVRDPATAQCEFDAMVSFAFNAGAGAFRSSSIARLHKAGARKIGDVSLSGLCAQAKAKADPSTMQIAFARWSSAGGSWSLGLFRRRVAELLVYGGHDADTAIKTAWGFHD
jgi:GH24 family phage-related lysozyme (muramidase)